MTLKSALNQAFKLKNYKTRTSFAKHGLISPSIEEPSQRDELHLSLNRFRLHIKSTLRQIKGEFNLIIPNKNFLINGDEIDEEYIENLEFLVYN
ncbi:unnamed protein product [Rotaria sp. Silwood2]|nr:unnamed protein product [Rotaria sp. Silwood2]